MEVMVHIRQAWIKDTSRFILRCKVQAVGTGKETHEGSVAIGQPSTTSNFAFTFATKPQEISLFFVAITPRQETTPNLENELGKCEGSLNTTASQHTQNLLFTRLIEGTNVETFAGRLTYTIHLSAAVGVDLQSLLADEGRRACLHVLPSESPFISIVFNCAYTRINPGSKLVGIARIGDRSDINVDMLLQSSSNELHSVPFLKPVNLNCQEFDCLELHIAESRSATVLFSISRPLNRLAPFKPIHYRYDEQTGSGGSLGSQSTNGNVSISVLYTPSSSWFNRFMGLEVVVCEVNLPRDLAQCRNIVMGTQIVQKNSKMKSPTLECHSLQPPFHSLTKKRCTTVNPSIDHDYHISVLRYHSKELNTALVKCYFLFSYSSKNSESIDLVFHIYGSSGNELWWNTDHCVAATLELTKDTFTMLQTGQLSSLHWKTSSEEPCNISGILRWKSKQTRFFTESSVREAFATQTQPLNNSTLESATLTTDLHDQSTRHTKEAPKPFDPTSINKTSAGMATRDHERMGMEGVADIFSQLAEFESMVNDFRILRREKQRLQGDIEQLQLQVTKVKSLIKANSQTQDDLPLSDLLLKVNSLQQKLQAEERAHERSRIRNQQLQNDLITRQDLETQYIQLREEHTTQKRLIQLLRGKLAKYHKCSDICKKQESIITQLESLLAKQAEGHPSSKDDAIALLIKENLHLRGLVHQYQNIGDHSQQLPALLEKDQTIQSLKSQLSQLFSHCQSLENERVCGDGGGGGGGGRGLEEKVKFETRVFELEQKLLVADAKLNAQTGQLQENAEKWMREKTQYELKLAAIQSRLDTVMKSGQQVLSTVHTEPTVAASLTARSETQCEDGGNVQRYISGKINTKEFSF